MSARVEGDARAAGRGEPRSPASTMIERSRPSPVFLLALGALVGVAAALVFATAHAFLIVPIWNRMFGGLAWGAGTGAIAAWTYTELYPELRSATMRTALRGGARYGALLWLAVSPVTAVDAGLRIAGLLPRFELVGVAVAVIGALAMGAFLGWRRTATRRGMIAGAAAVLALTIAMAGPVPIGNSPRAFAIFLSVLPAAAIGGGLVAGAISVLRK